jgi:hypothetical protein
LWDTESSVKSPSRSLTDTFADIKRPTLGRRKKPKTNKEGTEMNNLMERPNHSIAANGMAVSRAIAKARVGDAQALRWLNDQRAEGNHLAARALEDFQRAHGSETHTEK